MKFKNPQHTALYNDAITHIKAENFKAAIDELETLKLLLKESRGNKENVAIIGNLIQTLKLDPQGQLKLIQKLETEKRKSRIEDLENKANDLYNCNNFEEAAYVYAQIIKAANKSQEFALNTADALWSQGACFESIAAKLTATDPKEALGYIEKAINAVKNSLGVYISLNADEDIDTCTQKLKSLKEYRVAISTPNTAEFHLSLILQMAVQMLSPETSAPSSSLEILASVAGVESTPMYASIGHKKSLLQQFKDEKSLTVRPNDNSSDCKPA